MELRREQLDDAARRGVLTAAQARLLWDTLSREAAAPSPPPARRPVREALVVVGLILLPVAVHLSEHAIGWAADAPAPEDLGAWLLGHHLPTLAATAVAIAAALRRYRLPVLSAALVAVAWFAAMDAAPAIFGPAASWSQQALLSALVGLAALGTGFAVDGRTDRDHAGWLYLAGLVALWGGLSTTPAASQTSVMLYVLVQLWLLLAALLLRRRSFAAFGAVGLAGVAGRVADALLDPAALPIALALVVGALTAGALLWTRHEARIAAALVRRLPRRVLGLLPPGVAP